MRSDVIKLDFDMGTKMIFFILFLLCFFVYIFYSTHLLNFKLETPILSFKPETPVQAVLIALGLISVFCYWLYEEYFLADLNAKRIWKCKGNRFFIDITPFLDAEEINSFAVDFLSKGGGCCLIAITEEGEKIPICKSGRRPVHYKSDGEATSKLLNLRVPSSQ